MPAASFIRPTGITNSALVAYDAALVRAFEGPRRVPTRTTTQLSPLMTQPWRTSDASKYPSVGSYIGSCRVLEHLTKPESTPSLTAARAESGRQHETCPQRTT
jgi:hypothetical protein